MARVKAKIVRPSTADSPSLDNRSICISRINNLLQRLRPASGTSSSSTSSSGVQIRRPRREVLPSASEHTSPSPSPVTSLRSPDQSLVGLKKMKKGRKRRRAISSAIDNPANPNITLPAVPSLISTGIHITPRHPTHEGLQSVVQHRHPFRKRKETSTARPSTLTIPSPINNASAGICIRGRSTREAISSTFKHPPPASAFVAASPLESTLSHAEVERKYRRGKRKTTSRHASKSRRFRIDDHASARCVHAVYLWSVSRVSICVCAVYVRYASS